jgi:LPS-assembly protein
VTCHGKIRLLRGIFRLLLPGLALAFAQSALPQLSSTPAGAAATPVQANPTPAQANTATQSTPPAPNPASSASGPPTPPPPNGATIDRPDFAVKIPRIDAPLRGGYVMDADMQEAEGGIYHLHGHVVVELFDATFKSDDAEYDENTKTFKAHGNVYYRNYDRNEVIYCDRAEYNTDTARGTFYHVKGYTKTKVVARPGVLTTQEPFYFEGEWAEKIEEKYILHDGIITDCHIPHPWWTMHGKTFDIIPEERAITHNGIMHLHNVPVFYFPYFYKDLKKEPRKSGFLTPEAGHSSLFGYFYGLGYYWAINRSYDVEYLMTDYTSRGIAHHVDFRGKPSQKSDFDLIAYGVDDQGSPGSTTAKAPGASVTGTFKTEFGDGWTARGNIDYLSSFLFRQTFSFSFNEAIYSSTNSSAYVSKNFGYNTLNIDVSQNENYESTNSGDYVIIRKLPEVEYEGRDRQIASGDVPLWFSFDSSIATFHRVQPTSEPGFFETSQFTPRGDLEPSVTSAFRWKGIDIVPSFTMHETFYGQSFGNGAVISSALNRSAPEINLDIVFPAIERVYNKKTFLGDKLKHVIEPRLNYKYVTGINDFANTLRFDAIDLLADTNEVEAGITNRIYAKTGNTVKEVFTWEIFQERFFNPTFGGAVIAGQRNVTMTSLDLTGFSFLDGPRNYSPIVNILRAVPRYGIGIQWEGDYDPLLHRMTNSMLSVDVHYKRYSVSAGTTQVKPDPVVSGPANQFRAQFGYGDPNRKGWNAALSTVYDFRAGIQEFAIAQVTYNTDCCGVSFEYRRFNFGVRDDTGYRFAFTLANIGAIGNLKKQERLF